MMITGEFLCYERVEGNIIITTISSLPLFETYLIRQNLVGQNFRWTKFFVGQNFRHQAEISTILSDEFLSDKVVGVVVLTNLKDVFF